MKPEKRVSMRSSSILFLVACFMLFAAVFVIPAVQANDDASTTMNPLVKVKKLAEALIGKKKES